MSIETPLQLSDLLLGSGIDQQQEAVLVMRHRPTEKMLRDELPRWALEEPDMYNAYQCTQNSRAESSLARAKYLVSLIGHEAGRAVFVGIYSNCGNKPMTEQQYWEYPEYVRMKSIGLIGFDPSRQSVLFFNLKLLPNLSGYKGRLVINWPGPELAWFRVAKRNSFSVHAINNESLLRRPMPPWQELILEWDDLHRLPQAWKDILRQWRGIYFIFDKSDGRGYVGSAYGRDNLLGRWLGYAASGHGNNVLLRERNPENFRFSVLQRLGPDSDPEEVIAIEAGWKRRLNTLGYGLNRN